MYTDTSTFRIREGYGGFTIPKSLLMDLSWKSGDLIEFHGLSGEVIMIQRVCTAEKLQESKKQEKIEYNKEWTKKIAKFGGSKGTLGIKTFPKPLISEFNITDGQTIYFLPATNTWIGEGTKSSNLKEIVLVAFTKGNLRQWEELPKEDKEKEQIEFKKMLADKNHYNLHFFHGRTNISEKNSKRSKRRFERLKEGINNRIPDLKAEIERVKEELGEVESSNWRAKKGIAKTLRNYIKNLKLKIEELRVNPEKIF